MRNVDSIYFNGSWIRVGGNTPFQDLPSQKLIKNIRIEQPDPRNDEGTDLSYIYITFQDDYVIEMKAKEYLIGYQTFIDENS